MNQQEERNCVAVSCSSCFLKLSMLQKQTEKIENMLFWSVNILKFNDIQKRTESKNGTIFEAFAGFQVSCVANRGLP